MRSRAALLQVGQQTMRFSPEEQSFQWHACWIYVFHVSAWTLLWQNKMPQEVERCKYRAAPCMTVLHSVSWLQLVRAIPNFQPVLSSKRPGSQFHYVEPIGKIFRILGIEDKQTPNGVHLWGGPFSTITWRLSAFSSLGLLKAVKFLDRVIDQQQRE